MDISEYQRRELARRHLDSAEAWLRKLIEHEFSTAYGASYFSHQFEDGTYLINSNIRRDVCSRLRGKPERYLRDIDATYFGQAIKIVCNPTHYGKHFEAALKEAFPHGNEEARTFLTRLEGIRNQVSHGGTCSARNLERATCYTNDLADSIKNYFAGVNMERKYNVPTIVRFVDSLGNEANLEDVPGDNATRIIDWRESGNSDLWPGDTLRLEVEIDPTFPEDSYQVRWLIFGAESGTGPLQNIGLKDCHVNEQFEFRFTVVSNKEWHKSHGYDDALHLLYRVLPPIE